jgi:hypothetical protein
MKRENTFPKPTIAQMRGNCHLGWPDWSIVSDGISDGISARLAEVNEQLIPSMQKLPADIYLNRLEWMKCCATLKRIRMEIAMLPHKVTKDICRETVLYMQAANNAYFNKS